MNRHNIYFLTLSIFTVLCLLLVGVAIAYGNPYGILLAILGVVVFMGLGFRKKKQLREENE
jgi:Ca2+/Na+ antiporter